MSKCNEIITKYHTLATTIPQTVIEEMDRNYLLKIDGSVDIDYHADVAVGIIEAYQAGAYSAILNRLRYGGGYSDTKYEFKDVSSASHLLGIHGVSSVRENTHLDSAIKEMKLKAPLSLIEDYKESIHATAMYDTPLPQALIPNEYSKDGVHPSMIYRMINGYGSALDIQFIHAIIERAGGINAIKKAKLESVSVLYDAMLKRAEDFPEIHSAMTEQRDSIVNAVTSNVKGLFEHMERDLESPNPLTGYRTFVSTVSDLQQVAFNLHTEIRKAITDESNLSRERLNLAKMDMLFEKADIDEPIIVYRGVLGRRDESTVFHGLRIGDTFKDPGFMSTSLNPSIATSFGKGAGSIDSFLLVFNLKEGTKALPMQQHYEYNSECEVLINRDTEFVVTDIEQTPNVTRIFLTNKEES